MVCPHFESCDSREVVVTFVYDIYYGQTLQLHCAASGLGRQQGGTPTLNECKLILVDLHEGETDGAQA